MRNNWIYFFQGIVTVKLTGKGHERVINVLTRNQLFVWDVIRHSADSITFKMTLSDAKKLRHIIRKSPCKIEFLHRTGLPFLLKRLVNYSGFIAGALFFLLTLFILSNMIWGIEINGANPETEYKIRKKLDEMGIKKGQFLFVVDNPEGIQRQLSASIEEITWVGVHLQGTTYSLQVVERNIPEKQEKAGPQNLVAAKKAVIVDMFVEEGQPMVDIHDHVKPGQLLVSGEIGQEGKKETVSAKGEILGETWYKTEVVLPLKSSFQVMTGKEQIKHHLKFGKHKLPIWGFAKNTFAHYETEVEEKSFRIYKWALPVSYVMETFRESEKQTKVYTKDEGIEVAKDMARQDIKNSIPEDAIIKGEKVLHQSIENGKVYLSMHFQVIENIAKSYPIIQGASE